MRTPRRAAGRVVGAYGAQPAAGAALGSAAPKAGAVGASGSGASLDDMGETFTRVAPRGRRMAIVPAGSTRSWASASKIDSSGGRSKDRGVVDGRPTAPHPHTAKQSTMALTR